MDSDQARRTELANFLTSRRDSVQPADVGLPTGERRRTAGLRREEVAILAGVSPTWYTYLEQGRNIRPSVEVIDSLARVLRLSEDERRYVHKLALGLEPAALPVEVSGVSRDDLRRIVASAGQGPDPVYAIDWRCDVVAWNAAAAHWYTDWAALPAGRRNMLWWLVNAPEARSVLVDWERETRDLIGRCRRLSASRPDRERLDSVLAELRQSPEFAKWWDEHEVSGQQTRTRALVHPVDGMRRFHLDVLYPSGQDEFMVVLHPPADAPGGDGAAAGGW